MYQFNLVVSRTGTIFRRTIIDVPRNRCVTLNNLYITHSNRCGILTTFTFGRPCRLNEIMIRRLKDFLTLKKQPGAETSRRVGDTLTPPISLMCHSLTSYTIKQSAFLVNRTINTALV